MISHEHKSIRQVGEDDVEKPRWCVHVVQVLYDETVVNTVECLAKINASSKHSMRLSLIPCGVDKVEEFDQIMCYR